MEHEIVLTAFLIVFFAICAAIASYVTAVFLMYLTTRFYLYTPYDVFAYLSCPISGTCIEFGAEYRKMTLFYALDIFVTLAVILPLLFFFRKKIKDFLATKVKSGFIKNLIGKIKSKNRSYPDGTN